MTQDKIITIRVNEKEKEKLEQSGQNYGLSAGRYLKRKALNLPLLKPKFDFETGRKILLELSAQGNNLNQIARRLNQMNILDNLELDKLEKQFEEVEERYKNIWLSLHE